MCYADSWLGTPRWLPTGANRGFWLVMRLAIFCPALTAFLRRQQVGVQEKRAQLLPGRAAGLCASWFSARLAKRVIAVVSTRLAVDWRL